MKESILPDLDQVYFDRNSLNFSAGPGAIDLGVLKQLSSELLLHKDLGMSILGVSHRSRWFKSVVEEVELRMRRLLLLPPDWHVLLMQGGSSLQFGMIPMNFLPSDGFASYVRSGYWSCKSLADAMIFGSAKIAWDGKPFGFRRLPEEHELQLNTEAAYFHYVSNETVEGLQFNRVPGLDSVPRICDMSSDFLSGPIPVNSFSMIYAHAQKNLGPAGLTVVLISQGLIDQMQRPVPMMLDYRNHRDYHSIYNTPPVFSIYATLLVLRWLEEEVGGLEKMAARNHRKAQLLYQAIDNSQGFYTGHAEAESRSLMNITFTLPNKSLEKKFLKESLSKGFEGLDGHRSLGGVRASIYNAVSENACQSLVSFMNHFYQCNASS